LERIYYLKAIDIVSAAVKVDILVTLMIDGE